MTMTLVPSTLRRRAAAAASAAVLFAGCGTGGARTPDAAATATPIKHLVVIFDENVSFDHYFGAYPRAVNAPGEPVFTAAPGTPAVNGFTPALLERNPNVTNARNGNVASNPFRLARTQAATSSQSHDYTLEQMAYHGGAADLFPLYTGHGMMGGTGAFYTPAQVMGYYDGNTVTALWTYAQHFAMSDNAYSDQYGPSTPGAINLISGQTNGVVAAKSTYGTYVVDDGQGGKTLINDIDPTGDVCSNPLDDTVRLTGKNIGDLLSPANVTWGWFQGGFDIAAPGPTGDKGCLRSTYSAVVRRATADYIPHHEPFQYYASTANPTHARPSSIAAVGSNGDGANHQYDLSEFFAAVQAGVFPAVTYLKASAFQDGHAGYSDPLDEQTFLVQTLNFLQARPEWASTAVIVMYDDSDGWYRSRDGSGGERVVFDCGSAQRRRSVRREGDHAATAGRGRDRPGQRPVRSGHPAAIPRDLPVGQGELRGPHLDYSVVRAAVHRGQLARGDAARRRLVRRVGGLH